MKDKKTLFKRILSFVILTAIVYSAMSPAGTWMPRNPNWIDLLVLFMWGWGMANIDYVIKNRNKPKDPDDPEPPEGATPA